MAALRRATGRAALTGRPGEAPDELRLFVLGSNPSEKGTFVLDANDAAQVMQRYLARGTDVSFDYDHSILEPAGPPKPSAGYAKLESRLDGIYAVQIRWTDEARNLIESEKYRYFSPFFEHDEDGHILNIINVALTNTPALHGIPPLLAAASVLGRRVALARPRALLSVRRTRMTHEEMTAILEAAKPYMSAESLDKMAADLAAKVAEGAPPPPEEKKDKDGASADDPDKGTRDSSAPPPPPEKDSESAAAVASALAAIKQVTGEKSLDRAVGKLAAMGHSAPQVEALSKQLADLQADLRGRDVKERIDRAKRDGKLTPAMAAVEKEAVALGMVSLERLDAFLSALPKVAVTQGDKVPAGKTATALSAADVAPPAAGGVTETDYAIGKRLGLTPEQIQKGPEISAQLRLNPR